MIQRVTHETIQRSTLRNLQTNLSAVSRLQGQMSSGTKIQVPSDDPSGTGQALSLRATTSQLAQYQRNGQDGDSWLTTVDSALTTALGYVRNARDLVVQSGDAGLGQSSLNALADSIDGLKSGLLAQANSRYQGRNVFAGTSDASGAFSVDTSGATPVYTWTGSATAIHSRATPSFPRSKIPTASAPVPAGRRRRSWSRTTRRISSRLRPPISRPTARANMCSTTGGPTRGSARAANIIPSSRSPFRSRRCRVRGCWDRGRNNSWPQSKP